MRLIDADKAIDNINEWLDIVGYAVIGKGLSYYAELIGCIDESSTIEAEPIRRGHWELLHETESERLLACSNCNKWIRFDYDTYAPYCPFCGTKMDNIDGRWPMQTEENK